MKEETSWILKDVLALDRIYSFLTQYERHLCHVTILGRSKGLTERINKAIQLIQDTKWKEPPTVYNQDRVLYYTVDGNKIPASQYKSEIEEQVKQLLK